MNPLKNLKHLRFIFQSRQFQLSSLHFCLCTENHLFCICTPPNGPILRHLVNLGTSVILFENSIKHADIENVLGSYWHKTYNYRISILHIASRWLEPEFPVLLQAWPQYYIKHTAPDFPKISKMEIIRGLWQKGFYWIKTSTWNMLTGNKLEKARCHKLKTSIIDYKNCFFFFLVL